MHSSDRSLDNEIFEQIRFLEESLWKSGTRFDNVLMDRILAPDFYEFGRSGQTYSRSEMFFEEMPHHEIMATLPLIDFHARYLTDEVIQTTYVSEVLYDNKTLRGNRSSIWSRMDTSWRLRFHQGTPI